MKKEKVFSTLRFYELNPTWGKNSGRWFIDCDGMTKDEMREKYSTQDSWFVTPFNYIVLRVSKLLKMMKEKDYLNMDIDEIRYIKENATFAHLSLVHEEGNSVDNFGFLMSQIENLESKVIEARKPRYKLQLKVSGSGLLQVGFWKGDTFHIIGYINGRGKCNILNDVDMIEAYEKWRENGMEVESEILTRWHGGDYEITKTLYFKKANTTDGSIYSFHNCNAIMGCKDENIWRFEHNLRPILF